MVSGTDDDDNGTNTSAPTSAPRGGGDDANAAADLLVGVDVEEALAREREAARLEGEMVRERSSGQFKKIRPHANTIP